MASLSPVFNSTSSLNKTHISFSTASFPKGRSSFFFRHRVPKMPLMVPLSSSSSSDSHAVAEKPKKRYPGEGKGFVEEMRFISRKQHTRELSREVLEVERPEEKAVLKWEPSVDGYLRFLVDSKVVYDTLEGIVDKAAYPFYGEFKNTGLERSQSLAKDLAWFQEQGYTIPEPSSPGLEYSAILKELSEKDPQAFICHFFNIYFAHGAGGRLIGENVAAKFLNNKELEFYKWEGELSELLQNVRVKLNKIAESWTRKEKNHCLEETKKSFNYSGQLLRLIIS